MAAAINDFELEELVQEQERIARLEERTEHIQDDVAELKADVRRLADSVATLRLEIKDSFAAIDAKFAKLNVGRALDKIWWLSIAGGLFSVMARGFHWI